MKNFNTNTANSPEWLTPKWIVDALGPFDLDPCCAPQMPWRTAKTMFTKAEDGLKQLWHGRVWLNPPYGRAVFDWMRRLKAHGNGIAIIFARTDTKGFHETVFSDGGATGIFFFKGRVSFHRVDGKTVGPANAPSCLIAYGLKNYGRICDAMEAGTLQGALFPLMKLRPKFGRIVGG